jgi:hypothetical protein
MDSLPLGGGDGTLGVRGKDRKFRTTAECHAKKKWDTLSLSEKGQERVIQ